MQQLSLAFIPRAAAGTTGCFVRTVNISVSDGEENHGNYVKGVGRMGSSTFQCMGNGVSWTVRGTWGRAFLCDTMTPPCEHARTLSLGGSTNVLEGCTTALYVDGNMKVLCRWCPKGP